MIPVGLLVLLLALFLAHLSRRKAHVVAFIGIVAVVVWLLSVPDGRGASVLFVGVRVTLVEMDPMTRAIGLVVCFLAMTGIVLSAVGAFDSLPLASGIAVIGAAILVTMAGDWLAVVIGWVALVVVSAVCLWVDADASLGAVHRFVLVHAIGVLLLVGGVAVATGAVEQQWFLFGTSVLVTGTESVLVGLAIALSVGGVGLNQWLSRGVSEAKALPTLIIIGSFATAGVAVGGSGFPTGSIWLAYFGGLTALYGGIVAVMAPGPARALAAQAQIHGGIMLVGIGIGSPLGALAHLGLFVVALGLTLAGLGIRKNKTIPAAPKLGGLLVGFAGLTVVGVPGLGGFVSVGLVISEVQASMVRWLVIAGLIGSMVGFVRLAALPVVTDQYRPMNRGALGLAGMLTAVAVVTGLAPQTFLGILAPMYPWETPYQMGHVVEAVSYITVGAVTGLLDVRYRLSARLDFDLGWFVALAGITVFVKIIGVTDRFVAITTAILHWVGHWPLRFAHYPGETLEDGLPGKWRTRFARRRRLLPGTTGLKLTLTESVYVIVAILLFALIFGLK